MVKKDHKKNRKKKKRVEKTPLKDKYTACKMKNTDFYAYLFCTQ